MGLFPNKNSLNADTTPILDTDVNSSLALLAVPFCAHLMVALHQSIISSISFLFVGIHCLSRKSACAAEQSQTGRIIFMFAENSP
jgi:hypothetical protein